MAVPQFNLQHQTHRCCNQSKFLSVFRPNTRSHLTINTNFRFPNSIKPPNIRYKCFHFHIPNSGSAKDLSAPNIPKAEVLERWVIFMRSVLPGGSWWNLSDSNELGSKAREVKPVTVLLALRRIWALVADDRWVIYAALVSLAIVALSEISIPNFLAASVFSAQRGETAVFYRNSQLLILLCFVSGICSGVRSGCFGTANMILLKRLRETLFAVLIFQDLSFFDKEAVGDLTSRLGADCQRLSHVIENDGIGALINLLTLSWPLAFSTLVICSVLSTIFLFYGARIEGDVVTLVFVKKMMGDFKNQKCYSKLWTLSVSQFLAADIDNNSCVSKFWCEEFYDAYEDDVNVYEVMELCKGGELLDRILSRGGKYSEEDAPEREQ